MSFDTSLESRTFDGRPETVVGATYLVLTGVLVGVSGPFGLVAGLVIGATWYALGTPYAIAIGHVALVGLFPAGIDVASFLLVEVAFLVILIAEVGRSVYGVQFGVGTVVGLTLLGGGVWLGIRFYSVWIAAGLLILLLVSALYVLARSERIRLERAAETGQSNEST